MADMLINYADVMCVNTSISHIQFHDGRSLPFDLERAPGRKRTRSGAFTSSRFVRTPVELTGRIVVRIPGPDGYATRTFADWLDIARYFVDRPSYGLPIAVQG